MELLPLPREKYCFQTTAGFIGAIILVFFEDGHAPSTILGGIAGFFKNTIADFWIPSQP